MGYYRVTFGSSKIAGKGWFLGEPIDKDGVEFDSWPLRECRHAVLSSKLTIPILAPGNPLDFNLNPFSLPIVSKAVINAIQELPNLEIQIFPVSIQGSDEEYFVLNILAELSCLDKVKSDITFWEDSNGQPDESRGYRAVSNPTISNHLAKGYP